MIWLFIISTLCLLLILAIVAILSPLVINSHLCVKSTVDLSITVYWLNPFIIRLCYDYENEHFGIYLFGKQLNKTKKEMNTNEKTDDTIEKYEPVTTTAAKEKTETLKPKNEMTAPDLQKHEPPKSDLSNDNKKSLDTPIKKEKKKFSRKHNPEKKTSEEQKTDKPKLSLIERLKRNPYLFYAKNSQLRNKCLQWVKRIVISIFKIVQIRKCSLFVNAGLDDYSTTGRVYGYIEGIRHALNLYSKNILLVYQPLFSNDQISVKNELKIQSSLFRILFPVLITFATFPYLTFFMTWWDYRSYMKKGNINAKCG